MKVKKILLVFLALAFTVAMVDASIAKTKKVVKKKSSVVKTKALTAKQLKAKVKMVIGKAYVKKANKWVKLKVNTVLTKDDIIKLNKKSTVKLKTSNGKLIVVKGKKVVKMQTLFAESVSKKSMSSLVKKLGKGNQKSSFGPTAVAGVRGADVSKKKKKVKKEDLHWEKK